MKFEYYLKLITETGACKCHWTTLLSLKPIQELLNQIFFLFSYVGKVGNCKTSHKAYGILREDSNDLTCYCTYTHSFSRISTCHWKLHQSIKITHMPIMFFHFKPIIAITTSAKDISLELMAGWEAEPRATGSSQLVINPQEMPALPSLLLKHHSRKFSQFQYMEIWGYFASPRYSCELIGHHWAQRT